MQLCPSHVLAHSFPHNKRAANNASKAFEKHSDTGRPCVGASSLKPLQLNGSQVRTHHRKPSLHLSFQKAEWQWNFFVLLCYSAFQSYCLPFFCLRFPPQTLNSHFLSILAMSTKLQFLPPPQKMPVHYIARKTSSVKFTPSPVDCSLCFTQLAAHFRQMCLQQLLVRTQLRLTHAQLGALNVCFNKGLRLCVCVFGCLYACVCEHFLSECVYVCVVGGWGEVPQIKWKKPSLCLVYECVPCCTAPFSEFVN